MTVLPKKPDHSTDTFDGHHLHGNSKPNEWKTDNAVGASVVAEDGDERRDQAEEEDAQAEAEAEHQATRSSVGNRVARVNSQ